MFICMCIILDFAIQLGFQQFCAFNFQLILERKPLRVRWSLAAGVIMVNETFKAIYCAATFCPLVLKVDVMSTNQPICVY